MKQRVALLLVGILVGALIMVVLPVLAHHGPGLRRVRNQVSALRNRVANLEDAVFNCLSVQGISQFGIPNEEGYLYDNGVETFLETANDFDGSNDPDIFAMAADPACVSTSSRSTADRPFKQGDMGAQSPQRAKR